MRKTDHLYGAVNSLTPGEKREKRKGRPMQTIRVAKDLPIVGDIQQYEQNRLDFLLKIVRENGDIARYAQKVYIISHPDLIEQILRRSNRDFLVNENVWRPSTVEDRVADWMEKRRGVAAGLHRKIIQAYVEKAVSLTEALVDDWQEGKEIAVYEQMKRISCMITVTYFFGQKDGEPLIPLINKFIPALFQSIGSPFVFPKWLPMPSMARMRRSLERLDQAVYQLIAQRRKVPSETSDFLSMLIDTPDQNGKPVSDRAICESIVALIVASIHPTAAGLAWMWYLLATHPEQERAFYEEIEQVLGNRLPQAEDLPRLKYTDQVAKEAMRLYPPAWQIDRLIAKDCELGGYAFSKGESVIISPYVVQRDPRFYTDPERFVPERWSDEEATRALPKYAYLPFGSGPRMCQGATFASTELVLVPAVIARQFKLQLRNGATVKPNMHQVLFPDNLRMTVVQRKKH